MDTNQKWELFKEEYKKLLKEEGLDEKVEIVPKNAKANNNSKSKTKKATKKVERAITDKQKRYLDYLMKCYDKILEDDIEEFSVIIDEIFEKDLDKLTLKEASNYISRIKLMIHIKKEYDVQVELTEKQGETNAAIARFDNVISLSDYRNNKN